MPKTTAPLLSFSASGQIAKTQVYASWKGRPYVRRYVVPANPDTADQQEVRSVFSWLQNMYKFAAAGMTEAYDAYASSQVMTGRNALVKFNLATMQAAVDIEDLVFSPGARSGLVAADMTAVGGTGDIDVVLEAPQLPTGWTINRAFAAAIRDQDPHTGTLYEMVSAFDDTDPYEITLPGLTASELYVVGGWFRFTRPDGSNAYGRSLVRTATPS